MFDIKVDWKRFEICTSKEKKELLRYIEKLLDIKKDFDIKGIACFEAYLENGADDFENVGIDLVCQGCMPQMVSEILSNLIQATSLSNMQYVQKIIFTMFILMLQDGSFGLWNMKRILISYLGMEYSRYILTENL